MPLLNNLVFSALAAASSERISRLTLTASDHTKITRQIVQDTCELLARGNAVLEQN